MSKRLPYFNFYPTDFIRGVRGLTPQEVGIYTMLLCRIYEENGPVEIHDERLAAYCGCRVKTLRTTLDRLIVLGKIKALNGRITNDRAEDEIEKRNSVTESNSRAGKISAEKSKQNQRQDATPVKQPSDHTDRDTEEEERGGGGSAQARENPPQEILPPQTFREQLLDAIGADPISGLIGPNGRQLGTQADMAEAARWLGLPGITEAVAVAEVHRLASTKADGPPASFRYFTAAMCRLSGALAEPTLTPLPGAPRKESRHDQRAFNRTIDAIADGLDAGTVHVRDSGRDPFAQFGK